MRVSLEEGAAWGVGGGAQLLGNNPSQGGAARGKEAVPELQPPPPRTSEISRAPGRALPEGATLSGPLSTTPSLRGGPLKTSTGLDLLYLEWLRAEREEAGPPSQHEAPGLGQEGRGEHMSCPESENPRSPGAPWGRVGGPVCKVTLNQEPDTRWVVGETLPPLSLLFVSM